ncbi:MAG: glucosamine-6-phosphate deaminase, partial [Spirochaetaceae bacterium]
GESHFSPTRLTPVNYETQAAAAGDLGGIEVARNRLVITIGLETITWNPNATAVIMVAGESKAKIVRDAVCGETHVNVPASALRRLSGARMYLTEGAAKLLDRRDILKLSEAEKLDVREIERVVVDLAFGLGKRIVDLTEDDYRNDARGALVLKAEKNAVGKLNTTVADSLKRKIEAGMAGRSNTSFLHTEPHHDDIMLGYLPNVVRNIRDHSNRHHFVTLTSGFNAVTNGYMLDLSRKLRIFLRQEEQRIRDMVDSGYFSDRRFRDHDVWTYLDGLAAESADIQDEGTLRRFFRDLTEVFEELDVHEIQQRVDELINYFETQYPGKKDLPHIQSLKGMCREWESACLWGFFGWNQSAVEHLRLGFYKGETFTEEPTIERDALPVKELLSRVNPDVVTVAFDPEASGPDTHYKVMQAVSAGLRLYQKESGRTDLRVYGYRNIWYRFHPSEADVFVPVSLNMLTLQHHAFMSTYLTQKDASFPSYEHDGPFPELAQKIQVEQYEKLSTVLGREFFYEHPSPLMRATRGFVFLRDMSLDEFYAHSRELRRATEDR